MCRLITGQGLPGSLPVMGSLAQPLSLSLFSQGLDEWKVPFLESQPPPPTPLLKHKHLEQDKTALMSKSHRANPEQREKKPRRPLAGEAAFRASEACPCSVTHASSAEEPEAFA